MAVLGIAGCPMCEKNFSGGGFSALTQSEWYSKIMGYSLNGNNGIWRDIPMTAAAKELPACPVETTLTLISDKWKVLILRDLMPGTKRFGELKRSIGSVSQKVLTAQLREMEASGLLTRTVYPEVPPRVEYTLTELGKSLKPILDAMWNWGEAYQAKSKL